MLSPGATLSGNASTFGISNSGDEEAIPETCNGHVPLLLMVNGKSRKRVGHKLPKSPESGIIVAIVGFPTLAETGTVIERFSGSSLGIVRVAFAGPGPVGVNVTWNG